MWADLVDGDEAGAEALGLAPLLGGDDSRQSQTMEDARSRDAAALRAPPPRANAWGTPAPWGVATADAPAPDSVTPTRDDVSSGGKPASGARATPVSGAARLNAWGAAALAFKQAAAPAPARRSGHAAARRVALDSELDDSRDGINLALKGLLPKKNVWGFGGAGVKAVTGAVERGAMPAPASQGASTTAVRGAAAHKRKARDMDDEADDADEAEADAIAPADTASSIEADNSAVKKRAGADKKMRREGQVDASAAPSTSSRRSDGAAPAPPASPRAEAPAAETGAGPASSGRPALARSASESSESRQLAQRQKQIDIGKATPEYGRYAAAVPRSKHVKRNRKHPVTPDKTKKLSKRQWDGLVRTWRKALHEWDPPAASTPTAVSHAPLQRADSSPAAFPSLAGRGEAGAEAVEGTSGRSTPAGAWGKRSAAAAPAQPATSWAARAARS